MVIAIIFAAMLRKSCNNFNKLKDDLGVILDSDEGAVKAVTGDIIKKALPLLIISAVLLMAISTKCFVRGDLFMGTLYAVCAVYIIVIIIKGTSVKSPE